MALQQLFSHTFSLTETAFSLSLVAGLHVGVPSLVAALSGPINGYVIKGS
jgi:hypothetical protein